MNLHSMTITQILELNDPQLDALTEIEQRFVADIIIATVELEVGRRNPAMTDPRTALRQVMQDALARQNAAQKTH
jgi:hypothetical protein